jgi:carboxypeptidase C (cathepsin A)
MRCTHLAVGLVALTALHVLPGIAAAQVEAERPPVVTRHQLTVKGRSLSYTAEVGRIAIRDVETGEPHAYMFYTAYRVSSAGPTRPITFIWNGGPGWPALPLHFEVAGPKLGEGSRLVDNADTWLTETDLVMVDPVGTGWSRATKPEYVKEFAILVGDVMAVAEFTRSWLLLHDAENAPVFFAGESYGSGRAGRVGHAALKKGINVAGLMLISGATDLPTFENVHVVDRAMHVADMAVVGLHFGKTPRELGSTPDEVRRATEAWARERYLPAMLRMDSLSAAQKAEWAAEVARRTGAPAERISKERPLLTSQQWLGIFLVDGKRAPYSDFRVAAHPPKLWIPEALRHLRRTLGYRTDLPYLMTGAETLEQGFAPSGTYPQNMNARWVHSTIYDPTPEQFAKAREDFAKAGVLGIPKVGVMPSTPEAIVLNPKLKVLVAQGAFDGLGGCSINSERARRLDAPYRDAVIWKCYQGGHQMYLDPPARTAFSDDVKAFIRSTISPR